MKIEYWSDYQCPYCYIGETRLKNAIAELDMSNEVNLEMRAFEIYPDASKEVTEEAPLHLARTHGLGVDDAKHWMKEIAVQGRELGLDLRCTTALDSSSFDAHRLTKYAHTLDNTKVEQLLFDAYFTKNEALANHEVLLRVAAEAGLDPAATKEVLESDAFADEVRADEVAAHALGVTGVPFFVIDGKLAIPGALSVDAFKQALMQALDAELSEMQGATCGPDGCRY